MEPAPASGYGTAPPQNASRASGPNFRKIAVMYFSAMCMAAFAIAFVGRLSTHIATQQATQMLAVGTTELRQSDHQTAKLLEQGAELETESKSEKKAEALDLKTEKAIMKAKQDRKDSALKLSKAKELIEAAHNESLLSKQAGVQGHFFDHSVLSEHAQLNQVKQDIKTLMRKFGMAKLAAERAHKILMTSVGLSTRQDNSVTSDDKQITNLKAEALAASKKAAELRKRATKMEIQKGSPRQMIQDIEVSKLRNEAKHQDEHAQMLNDRIESINKEIMLLSPSAKKDQSQGNALREGYMRKLHIAQYYADKVKALNAQKAKVEKLFDAHMNDGSSLLARASSSKSNAMKLRQEAERPQQQGTAEARDADKQETIARKFRDDAMRLRVGALAKKQAAAAHMAQH